tara:strand:+ start:959 stop:1438 length:480 start_codon:yes stop_codon:yes gene_type:complete
MGGSSAGAGSSTGGSGGPPKQNVVQKVVSSTVNYVKGGGMIGAGIRAVGRAKEQNRRNQLTSQFASEEGPIGSRNNNNMSGGDNGGNDTAPTQVATNVGGTIVTAPSSAEVSQSNATDVTYDSRKTKAKGRSMTILTSARGVRNNTNAVLGTKSLLGRA